MRSTKFETFVWLARLGSFRAVAERLNLTQPAITQRISALESALGVQLFDRGTRGVTLTPKGMEILPYAEQHIEAVDQIVLRCADPSVHFDAIRLGVVETVAHVWLDALLQRLQQRFPGITLELVVDSTAVLHDYLLSAELDVALLLGPISDPRLADHWLCSYPLVWVAGAGFDIPDRCVSLEELAQWPIMTYSRRSLPYRMITGLFRPLEKSRVRISASSSLETTIRVVKQGRAVSALPRIVVQPDVDKGHLAIFETQSALPPLEYVAAYSVNPTHPLIEAVVEMARDIAMSSGD